VRPEEIDRLDWQQIDLDRATVTIGAAASKIRRRRVTPLSPVAVEWLRLGGDLPLPLTTRRRCIRRLRDRLGFEEWPQDILRHSAASYLLSQEKDAAKVALWLGNSPKILLGHYHEMVKPEDVADFWQIRPGEQNLTFVFDQ
jgi:integrase